MFRTALANKPAELQGNFLTGDGVHMNGRGYAVMALGMLRALGVADEVSASTTIVWPPPRMSPADIFTANRFSLPGQTNSLPYRFGKPAKLAAGKRYPLVLCLHGAGERGTDNERQVGYFRPLLDQVMAAMPCYVVIPQVPGKQLWATYGWSCSTETMPEQPSPTMALTRQLLDQLLASEQVDPDRVYVTGVSMGGYGTWEMIQRWPELFAAAIPVCGGGDPAHAAKLAKLPIWAWHGEADTTIKVEKTRRMIEAITTAGGQPKVTYIPNGGHSAWTAAYKEPELTKWLLAQKRGATR